MPDVKQQIVQVIHRAPALSLITFLKEWEEGLQSSYTSTNEISTLVFRSKNAEQRYKFPFQVLMFLCPAIDSSFQQTDAEITDASKLTFIVTLDSLGFVPTVVEYLNRWSDIIDESGQMRKLGTGDGDIISFYEIMKVGEALAMQSIVQEMRDYLTDFQYRKGARRWLADQGCLTYLLKDTGENHWLHKELTMSIARTKLAGALAHSEELLESLKRDDLSSYRCVITFMARLKATKKVSKAKFEQKLEFQ